MVPKVTPIPALIAVANRLRAQVRFPAETGSLTRERHRAVLDIRRDHDGRYNRVQNCGFRGAHEAKEYKQCSSVLLLES